MPDSGTMPGPDSQEPADLLQLALPRSQKVVLVIDLVESVRLMSADEAGTVARWHSFVQTAQNHTIPAQRGRLVKSLGDGLMVEFEEARDAVNAAQNLHGVINLANAGLQADHQMHLRAGINATHVFTDNNDIYGAGVNLAARIATLAGPGETVVSASVRDGLTDGLDASIEDLGECYLKHIVEPVRLYRLGEVGANSVLPPKGDYGAPMQPAIAVVPFTNRNQSTEHFAAGELIADGIIARLSKTRELKVISRLSTSVFRDRNAGSQAIEKALGASYVLAGSYLLNDTKLIVTVELVDAKTGHILWANRLQSPLQDLFEPSSELCCTLADQCHAAIMASELHSAVTQPLPTLQSYSLLLGAMNLMHRASFKEFDQARRMLERLMEMHRRHALPYAWMAKWYVLKAAQGWSVDPKREASAALASCAKALEYDNQSALALAVTGQVQGYLNKDLDTAENYYHQALACNPNESLAWLWLGMNSGFKGDNHDAADATERALLLSPLDPLRYYYESLAASACVAAQRYERTIELAEHSLRLNRTHSSTYRALAIAQALSGKEDESRRTIRQLLVLEPTFTVTRFLQRMPGASTAPGYANKLAEALRSAGLPE